MSDEAATPDGRAEVRGDGGVPCSLAALPFPRRGALELLNLQADPGGGRREVPDHDFAGFGYGRVRDLVLADDDGQERSLAAALVLALHSSDDQPDQGEEVELEFDLPDPDDERETLSVLAPLSRFLEARLPALLDEVDDVVLALCNPRSVDVARPASLGPRRLHYAHGDVVSWLDLDDDGPARIRLAARSWHVLR